ncbi:MAG: O-antigen ligase family protein [Gemmatimonadota bacterium]
MYVTPTLTLVHASPRTVVVPRAARRNAWLQVPTSALTGMASLLLVGVTALLLLTHHSAVLTLAFPAMATVLGAWLLFTDPGRYLAFVLWLWMLAPFVRRVVDAQNGWNQQNPILLAPLLVCGLCAFDALYHAPRLARVVALPFVVGVASLLGAVLVGLFLTPPSLVLYAAMSWMAPLLLGLHVAIHPEHREAYHRAISRTLVVGVIAMGIYGVAQFVMPAEWDRLWMINSRMDSIGEPLPLRVRVFSTMNAPGPLAQFLTVALLIVLGLRTKFKWPTLAAGLLLLLMSLARSAWLGFAVGVALLLAVAPRPARRGAIGLVVGAVLALVVAAAAPLPTALASLRHTIASRLTTIGDLSMDDSFRARRYLIPALVADIGEQPLGSGLGSTLVGGARGRATARLADQGLYLDNGILEVLLVMGWVGGLLFLGSAGGATWLAWRGTRGRPTGYGYFAGAVALLAQVVGATIFTGVGGAMLWLSMSMAMTTEGET